MKNIHILPTPNSSRLIINASGVLTLGKEIYTISENRQNIYITSDEEIKEGDWVYNLKTNRVDKATFSLNPKSISKLNWRKIILTTDIDLIEDGVQPIPDKFLEWFVKNSSCEEVKIESTYKDFNPITYTHKIIIPKEEPKQEWDINTCRYWDMEIGCEREKCICENQEPKQETLEEVAEKIFKTYSNNTSLAEGHYEYMMDKEDFKQAFSEIAKWQQERMYSEEEIEKIISKLMDEVHRGDICFGDNIIDFKVSPRQWFEQFKKK